MSQYPSPYSPPSPPNVNYYAYPAVDPRSPAKRASLLMIILGAMFIAFSGCLAGVGQLSKTIALPPEMAAKMQEIQSQTGMSFARLALGMGITIFVFAAIMIALGITVRSGRKTPIVLSIIATGMTLLFITMLIFSAVAEAIMRHDPGSFVGACMWTFPGALAGLLLVWLTSAFRAAPQIDVQQSQYAAQYWQYQQNMQNYGGYGYGAAAPPLPPNTDNSDNPPPPA